MERLLRAPLQHSQQILTLHKLEADASGFRGAIHKKSSMTDPQTPNNAEENEATSTEGVAADHTSSEAPASTNEQEGANADPPKPQPTTAVRAGKKSDKKDKKKDGLWHGTFKPILEVVVVVFLFRALIIDWNDVPSGSMLPTIQIGDRIAVNRLAYGLNLPIPFLRHDKQGKGFLDLPFTDKRMPFPLPGQIIRWNDPDRGDIVIVWSPQEDHNLGTRLVKRIVAIPGDTVKVANGELYINGIKGEYEPIESSFMQTADQGRTREIQRYTESFPELDFEHVMQMPIQFPPGKAYDQVVNDLTHKMLTSSPASCLDFLSKRLSKRLQSVPMKKLIRSARLKTCTTHPSAHWKKANTCAWATTVNFPTTAASSAQCLASRSLAAHLVSPSHLKTAR